jgi:hypothetical protein
VSVFQREGHRVFRTYQAYARGVDPLIGTGFGHQQISTWSGWNDSLPCRRLAGSTCLIRRQHFTRF